MKVELPPSSSLYTDDDQQNLKQLLEAFGSAVSLEDIASAYCETGRNLDSTADLLCNLQRSTPVTTVSDSVAKITAASSATPSNNYLDADNSKTKPKRCPASMGTVSDVIGREYIKPRPHTNQSHEKYKPVILNSDDFPVSEIWDERKDSASTSRSESMNSDIEEFLYKMLGNGFQLEKSVIQKIVGQCGYNVQESIDTLLDLSAASLEKSDDVIGIATGNTINTINLKTTSSVAQSSFTDISGRLNADRRGGDEMKRKDMQREILEVLFGGRDGIEDKQESTRPIKPARRSPYGQVVTKPLEETIVEDFTFITRQPVKNRNHDENQDSYDELRKAVTEYWLIMKEYYKAAIDAFTRKDYEKAQELLEEGHFYMRKAREADEKSATKMIDGSDDEEDVSINVHYLDPKDALHHMKLNLTSFCGLESIHNLKVVVGTDGGGKQDDRRKRLITRLLEKEGIPWTEEGNDGWTISIRADKIDPKKLSFGNK